jgi:Putative auto-transporter adhesin, head GIN domain
MKTKPEQQTATSETGILSETRPSAANPTRKPKALALGFATLAMGFAMSGCTAEWEVGVGEVSTVTVTEVRQLHSFYRVQIHGDAHVTVVAGGSYSARVTADEYDVSDCVTEVRNGTLEIRGSGWGYGDGVPEIVITSPNLTTFIHDGDGDVLFDAGYAYDNVTLELNGEGNLDFRGHVDRLNATVNGGGVMTLEGEARVLNAQVNSWGALYADPLLASVISGTMAGSGDLTLAPENGARMEITVTGSGYVEWWGNPGTTQYRLIGTGTIIEHDGLYKKGAQTRAPRHGKKPAT